MADLAHVMGEDLQLAGNGDLAVVMADQETQQRVLHRLLTGAGTYIWQLAYGAGLPGLIGTVASQQQIAAIIKAQMAYEAAVSATPEPRVVLSNGSLGVVLAEITYTDALSGGSQTLTLPIGG